MRQSLAAGDYSLVDRQINNPTVPKFEDTGDASLAPARSHASIKPSPMQGHVSRRTLMNYLAIAPAALAAATVAPSAVLARQDVGLTIVAEDAAPRIDRLMRELADALAGYCGGQFRAVVEAGPDGAAWLQNVHADAGAGVAGHLAEGTALIVHRGRNYLVDTADVPSRQIVRQEDQGAGGWTECYYVPKARARYAYLRLNGEIEVGPLAVGSSDWRLHERRIGYRRRSRQVERVIVLGLVISD
jgi:hypothetical protein